MAEVLRFPFHARDKRWEDDTKLPFLPLTLVLGSQSVDVVGLLDTGSMVNVLPFGVGIQLGAIWEQQETPLELGGNLAKAESRGLVVSAQVGNFDPVFLTFAWVRTDTVPVILGQSNFFRHYDVFFSRSREFFEVAPKP